MTLNASGAAHRSPEGKWYLWPSGGGERLAHWPVDAQLLIANGTHTATPPTDAPLPEDDLRGGHVPASGPLKVQGGVLVEAVEPHRVENEYPPALPL